VALRGSLASECEFPASPNMSSWTMLQWGVVRTGVVASCMEDQHKQ
jgi:hypothetical protein